MANEVHGLYQYMYSISNGSSDGSQPYDANSVWELPKVQYATNQQTRCQELEQVIGWLKVLARAISVSNRSVQTIVRTIGRQSGQSGRCFKKPKPVRPRPQKPTDA